MAGRRAAASGHKVTLSAESYARSILAAAELGESVHAFAERAVIDALARHETQRFHNGQRAARRQELGQSTPGPMQGGPMRMPGAGGGAGSRPSGSWTRWR